MFKIAEGKRVFDKEIEALCMTRDAMDSVFEDFVNLFLDCRGKVITMGTGKSGHVAMKIASTLSSLGTPSFFLNPSEASHGDVGVVAENDIVLCISNSGECEEIKAVLPVIRKIGARVVAFTGSVESTLARQADLVQVFPGIREACYLGLAPTSSTTVMQCYGDALAVVTSMARNFDGDHFRRFHPSGALGRRSETH